MSLSVGEKRIATACSTKREAEARLERPGLNERVARLCRSVRSTLADVITNTVFVGLVIVACALPGSSQLTTIKNTLEGSP